MFNKTKRSAIIVYLYYNRDARKLNKYGHVYYHSHRLRYLLIYVDEDKVEKTLEELEQQRFVKQVLPSYRDQIDQNFVGNLTR